MGQETIDKLKAKLARMEELLESSNDLSWQRAKEILKLRELNLILQLENQELKNELGRDNER